MGERESSARYCPTHRRRLQEIAPSRKAPDGLWCPEGHAPARWDVVDTLSGRTMAKSARHGVIPSVFSRPVTVARGTLRRACVCARCGRAWEARCSCVVATDGESAVISIVHSVNCEPPRQCPNGHRNWQRPKRG